ncbi:MAG: Ppx/GppA phosphatase family protein [Pseudomonadota bacterium]
MVNLSKLIVPASSLAAPSNGTDAGALGETVPHQAIRDGLTSQGRLAGYGPIAVIDIGSNSVRLVAYERLARALTPLYNEKVLCGLGRGLAETGQLSDEAVERTLSTLARFRHLADQMRIKDVTVIATAAVRDASNGDAFMQNASRILKTELTILSGLEEARAAASGILSGFYKPDGIVGDLGGGSLELLELRQNEAGQSEMGEGVSHRLGVIRMQEEAKNDPKLAAEIARKRLADDELAHSLKGRTLFLVGGTWRNLAKLHMEMNNYPLSVMHGYAVEAKEFAGLCRDVAKGKLADHPAMSVVARSRRSLLPYGAAVLQALFEVSMPEQVMFSALGVREGLLFDQLDAHERARDPLLDAAYELAILRSRSPVHARELAQWTGHAFAALGVGETDNEARLREAASLLADIGWRAHPDYRGVQSHNIIAHGAFTGIDHPGRLYLAMANYYRHEGLSANGLDARFAGLLTPRLKERTQVLGSLFRVAYALTASMAGVLPEARLEASEEGRLTLYLPERLSGLQGDRLSKRLGSLARLMGCDEAVVAIR